MEREHLNQLEDYLQRLIRNEITIDSIKELLTTGLSDLKELVQEQNNKIEAQNAKIDELWKFVWRGKAFGILLMTIGAGITFILDRYSEVVGWSKRWLAGH